MDLVPKKRIFRKKLIHLNTNGHFTQVTNSEQGRVILKEWHKNFEVDSEISIMYKKIRNNSKYNRLRAQHLTNKLFIYIGLTITLYYVIMLFIQFS